MAHFLVTRHVQTLEWIVRQGIDVAAVHHIDPSRINVGDVVVGTLPVHLVAELNNRGARYLHLELHLPESDRGRELNEDDLDRFGARLVEYHATKVTQNFARETLFECREKSRTFYIAIDGDDIGSKLESIMFSDQVDAVKTFSNLVRRAMDDISKLLLEKGCRIIFQEGDSILSISDAAFEFDKIKLNHGVITFSAGISNTLPEAILALKYAKGLGKNRLIIRNEARL